MIVSLVAAMDRERLIGRGNALPWRLPADMRYFKSITMGKPVIMGRRTHESIGRALPGRDNVVVTRDARYRAEGCTVVHDLDSALERAAASPEAMVIGGAEIYAAALPRAERLYLTIIDAVFDGDTRFPAWDPDEWREHAREAHAPDERNPWPFAFVELRRVSARAPAR